MKPEIVISIISLVWSIASSIFLYYRDSKTRKIANEAAKRAEEREIRELKISESTFKSNSSNFNVKLKEMNLVNPYETMKETLQGSNIDCVFEITNITDIDALNVTINDPNVVNNSNEHFLAAKSSVQIPYTLQLHKCIRIAPEYKRLPEGEESHEMDFRIYKYTTQIHWYNGAQRLSLDLSFRFAIHEEKYTYGQNCNVFPLDNEKCELGEITLD